jgi:hypothetical protein
MRLNRSIAPIAVSLGLAVLLAACAQAANPTPSTPSAPSVPSPSASPTPIAPPSADPSVAPSPSPIEVVEHELPMVARATEGVDVRSLPSADAPLLEGDRYSDMARVEIRLEADQLVQVTLGPVVADGTSWYEIRATDGGDFNFENGWVPGEVLAPEGPLPANYAQIVVIYGLGSGTAVNVDVPMGTPTTVRFAAVPTADRDECEIDVTLVRTDGLGVNVATNTVTEAEAFQLAADQLSSLFMEEAGTATLQVRTDCNYSAALIQPPY